MKPPRLIVAIITSLAVILPAFADDHEDERDHQRRTKSEIRAFLEKHFPEPLEHLRHAEEEENEEGVEEFWHEAGEFVGEFYHASEELGGQAAEHYLLLRRTEFKADRLTDELHETDDDERYEELKKELRKTIAAHVEHRLHFERAELQRAKRDLEEATRELEEAFAHHREIVDDELHERLHREEEDREEHGDEHEPEGDDEEEDEDEDDEEDEDEDDDDEEREEDDDER